MLIYTQSSAQQLSSWNSSPKVFKRDLLTVLRIAYSGTKCSCNAKKASKRSSKIHMQLPLLFTTKISKKIFAISTNCLETSSFAVTFTRIVFFQIQLYGRYCKASQVYRLMKEFNHKVMTIPLKQPSNSSTRLVILSIPISRKLNGGPKMKFL